jgi:aminoglycoside phosphotransferase
MTLSNVQLLQSQEAFQKLVSQDLRGVYALRVLDIADAMERRLKKLQSVEEDLRGQVDEEALTQEEANEQWQEVLDEELEVEEPPLPRAAVRQATLSAGDLKQLKWLFQDSPETDDAQNDE